MAEDATLALDEHTADFYPDNAAVAQPEAAGLDDLTAENAAVAEPEAEVGAFEPAIPALASAAPATVPVTLPLSNVVKCVRAATPLLQTRAAKDLLARSAAIFTVYLAST